MVMQHTVNMSWPKGPTKVRFFLVPINFNLTMISYLLLVIFGTRGDIR